MLVAGLCFDKIKKASAKKRKQTVLVYKGRKTSAEGFSDSGNLLNYKGIPVILAKHSIFEKLFGNGFDDIRSVGEVAVGENADISFLMIRPINSIINYFYLQYSKQL